MKHARFAIALFVSTILVACSDAGDEGKLGSNRSGLDSELVEGQECPPAKCEGEAFATAADGTTPDASSFHCVAGPQVGSGVGVCHLAPK